MSSGEEATILCEESGEFMSPLVYRLRRGIVDRKKGTVLTFPAPYDVLNSLLPVQRPSRAKADTASAKSSLVRKPELDEALLAVKRLRTSEPLTFRNLNSSMILSVNKVQSMESREKGESLSVPSSAGIFPSGSVGVQCIPVKKVTAPIVTPISVYAEGSASATLQPNSDYVARNDFPSCSYVPVNTSYPQNVTSTENWFQHGMEWTTSYPSWNNYYRSQGDQYGFSYGGMINSPNPGPSTGVWGVGGAMCPPSHEDSPHPIGDWTVEGSAPNSQWNTSWRGSW